MSTQVDDDRRTITGRLLIRSVERCPVCDGPMHSELASGVWAECSRWGAVCDRCAREHDADSVRVIGAIRSGKRRRLLAARMVATVDAPAMLDEIADALEMAFLSGVPPSRIRAVLESAVTAQMAHEHYVEHGGDC